MTQPTDLQVYTWSIAAGAVMVMGMAYTGFALIRAQELVFSRKTLFRMSFRLLLLNTAPWILDYYVDLSWASWLLFNLLAVLGLIIALVATIKLTPYRQGFDHTISMPSDTWA